MMKAHSHSEQFDVQSTPTFAFLELNRQPISISSHSRYRIPGQLRIMTEQNVIYTKSSWHFTFPTYGGYLTRKILIKIKGLTVTVRTTPPLAPSRAMARETAFTTNFWGRKSK